jgi:hypothetical protein
MGHLEQSKTGCLTCQGFSARSAARVHWVAREQHGLHAPGILAWGWHHATCWYTGIGIRPRSITEMHPPSKRDNAGSSPAGGTGQTCRELTAVARICTSSVFFGVCDNSRYSWQPLAAPDSGPALHRFLHRPGRRTHGRNQHPSPASSASPRSAQGDQRQHAPHGRLLDAKTTWEMIPRPDALECNKRATTDGGLLWGPGACGAIPTVTEDLFREAAWAGVSCSGCFRRSPGLLDTALPGSPSRGRNASGLWPSVVGQNDGGDGKSLE